jgi:hypothetical protein
MSNAAYKVILPKNKRPGLQNCGAYAPGKEYEVGAAEAVRLVDVKGFEFVTKTDDKAARAEMAKAEAAKAAAAAASANDKAEG